MGMEIQGINPNGATGQYFARRIGCWAELWDYCCSVSPVAKQVKLPYTNDGDGLDAQQASTLAKALEGELRSGRTSEYIELENMLAETPEPDQPCYPCNGTGKVWPPKSHYQLKESDICDFVDFLKRSGGFEIW